MENQKQIPPDKAGIFPTRSGQAGRYARMESLRSGSTDAVRHRGVLPAIGERASDAAAAAGFREGTAKLVDVLRRLRRAPLQRAPSDQHFQCVLARSEVGLSDHGWRQIRNDTACC